MSYLCINKRGIINNQLKNYSIMKNTITKKLFVELYDFATMQNHLNLTFVEFNGKKIGYLFNGKIKPMPTTKTSIADLYPFFVETVEETAFPQFSKGGKYARHNGEGIKVVSTISVTDIVGKNWLAKTCKGYTPTGRASNSYIISSTTPSVCKVVSIFELKIK